MLQVRSSPARLCVLTARGTDFLPARTGQDMLAIDQQFNVVGRLFVQVQFFSVFMFTSTLRRVLRDVSNKGDQEESTNQVKEAHGDNRGVKPILSAVTPIIRENRKLRSTRQNRACR